MAYFTLSSESVRFLFSGPYRLRSYYKKILSGHKRKESTIHFCSILIGLLFGLLSANTLFYEISKDLAEFFDVKFLQIIVNIIWSITLGMVLSSICYGISKCGVDMYNVKKYGVNNSQLAPLNEIEITNIHNNCVEELTIDKNGIIQLHETICTFIKESISKEDKRKLKTAHWLFRKGSISDACKFHTLFADAVVNNMINTPLSRDFIKKRTNIAYLTNHLQQGISCGNIENYINNMSEKLESLIEDLTLLKDKIQMGTKGFISRNSSKDNIDENI